MTSYKLQLSQDGAKVLEEQIACIFRWPAKIEAEIYSKTVITMALCKGSSAVGPP
jgi:hypothetical protein